MPYVEPNHKVCTRCGVDKPIDAYRKRSGQPYRMSWCRDCQREHARQRQRERRADPDTNERIKANKRRSHRTERGRAGKKRRTDRANAARRARIRSLPYQWTDDDWQAALAAFGHRCAYCDSTDRLTIEHVIPLSDPACPGTVIGNIAPACAPCNAIKRDEPLTEFVDAERVAYVLNVLNVLTAAAA